MKLTIPLVAASAVVLSSMATTALPLESQQQPFQVSMQMQMPMDMDIVPSGGFATSIFRTLTSSFKDLFSARLVQTSGEEQPYWTTEFGKQLLFYRGINFMDITDHQSLGLLSASNNKAGLQAGLMGKSKFPTKVAHKKTLKGKVFKEISKEGPKKNLAKFTSFHTRYYKSETGRQSQQWLLQTVKDVVSSSVSKANNNRDVKSDITVREFPHPWGQNSIILNVPGSNSSRTEAEGITILGAHQDSTNLFPFFAAPGADDDGSGTVTIIETLRVLLETGWKPETDVEWHWYSAEEGGLLGSQAVASDYEKRNVKVKAMLQQDMTAFVKSGTKETVGLVSDYVSEPLTKFISILVDEYLDIGYTETKLGYAGSDHASWSKIGADSAFAIEATFENSNLKRIHTTQDTFDYPEFSFDHLMQFVRLSASFVVELAGWSKSK